MQPRPSIAARCFTMTFRRAMRSAPRASVTVMIIGMNSGVSPTASATPNSSDSRTGRPSAEPASITNTTSTSTMRAISVENAVRPRSNSVGGGRSARRPATSPNIVAMPVANTTAVAVPVITDVPA